MDTRQLRENRAAFPAADLANYRGQWVAFSIDGRRIVASAPDLVELDTLLLAMGENPEQVALEYIDGVDLQVLADLDAVMKRIIDGTPVDPETSRRTEERADRITEEIRRTQGVMDDATFEALLHDDEDA
jgi:hypothetical protein